MLLPKALSLYIHPKLREWATNANMLLTRNRSNSAAGPLGILQNTVHLALGEAATSSHQCSSEEEVCWAAGLTTLA